MGRIQKKAYVVNLSSMHSTCEMNYLRLCRLFPDYEKANRRDFLVGEARASIEVVERCRYTTIFRVHQVGGTYLKWMAGLRFELRAYHDVGMLEITTFHVKERLAPRYNYPNPHMYQEDEKNQQNLFLADWLQNCLVNGRSSILVCE